MAHFAGSHGQRRARRQIPEPARDQVALYQATIAVKNECPIILGEMRWQAAKQLMGISAMSMKWIFGIPRPWQVACEKLADRVKI